MSEPSYNEVPFSARYGRWYAIYTAPQCERFVLGSVLSLGFAAHLPEIREVEIRRGRKVDVVRPEIPRYVFALLRDNDDWTPILKIECVHRIISNMPAMNARYVMPSRLSDAEVKRMFCETMHEGIVGWLVREGLIKMPSRRQMKRSARVRRHLAKKAAA